MAITNFFIRRPCVSIITPYVLLVIFAVITFAAGFIELSFEQDDSGLVNDDPMVVERDMIRFAHKNLNREEEGIDDARDKLLEDQVRYETGGFNRILLIYEEKEAGPLGLLTKSVIETIIKVEQEMISWDKPS